MKTLIIFAHPGVSGPSIANTRIIDKACQQDGVAVRDLYRLYPDFKVDIEAEQAALAEADLIILQYPFHWYSVPSLLKEWIDQVMRYGFAYGTDGDKLHGKGLMVSTTIGGPASSYCEEGHNHFEVETLLTPLHQTANFTGMRFLKPVVSHDMVLVPPEEERKTAIESRADDHALRLIAAIEQYQLSLMDAAA